MSLPPDPQISLRHALDFVPQGLAVFDADLRLVTSNARYAELQGLPAALVGIPAGGSAYRIVGRRRIARLAELIGEPPRQVPAGFWPE